jgi:hypothetical protein
MICIGVILRLAQYIFNRSLWFDEAALALNIMTRSFSELLQPLDYNQGAPVGFLIVEKLAIRALGKSDYALRVFPFVCGVLSLFLFYRVAKRYIDARAVPVALGLFAISGQLIYYSSEVKQYSSDVCVALVLYAVVLHVQSRPSTALHMAFLGIVGGAAIWLSHPAAFILAGVGLSMSCTYLGRREWPKIGRLSIAFLIWTLSFVGAYLVSLRDLIHNRALQRYWAEAFMPLPSITVSYFTWLVETFFRVFIVPIGLPLNGIAALTFLIGCVSMFLRKREDFFVLISPLAFLLAASGLQLYPLGGRLLLFGVPFALLFIALGADRIIGKASEESRVIGIVLIGLLALHPTLSAGSHLLTPRTFEEIQPVMSYFKEHRREGDLLYLYYGASLAFSYYAEDYGFRRGEYVIGVASRDNWKRYAGDLDRLRGNKRVWLLFSHVHKDEERLFLSHLQGIGMRLDSFTAPGAAVYLYDLGIS